ncbi:MAG TPA: methyltransferase domain-containing protein [Herpetosiphonaceae bacterium]
MAIEVIPPHDVHERLPELEQRYRTLYTAEAIQYDRVRFDHSRGQSFNSREQTTIERLLGLAPGQSVVDVAAGTGRITAYLASRGLNVTAIDLTPNMLQQAQNRAAAGGLDNIRFVEANGRMLPFADGSFDAAMSIRFLHLFPAAMHRPFVQEMWRVLRPGGTLLIQFDSALAGGIVPLLQEPYRRLMRGHKPRYYLSPHQLGQVFAGIDGISLHGFSSVGGGKLRSLHPGMAAKIEQFVAQGWRSFLAYRVFVRAVKPAVVPHQRYDNPYLETELELEVLTWRSSEWRRVC